MRIINETAYPLELLNEAIKYARPSPTVLQKTKYLTFKYNKRNPFEVEGDTSTFGDDRFRFFQIEVFVPKPRTANTRYDQFPEIDTRKGYIRVVSQDIMDGLIHVLAHEFQHVSQQLTSPIMAYHVESTSNTPTLLQHSENRFSKQQRMVERDADLNAIYKTASWKAATRPQEVGQSLFSHFIEQARRRR